MFLLSGCFWAAAGVKQNVKIMMPITRPFTRPLTQPFVHESSRNMCPPVWFPPPREHVPTQGNCAKLFPVRCPDRHPQLGRECTPIAFPPPITSIWRGGHSLEKPICRGSFRFSALVHPFIHPPNASDIGAGTL